LNTILLEEIKTNIKEKQKIEDLKGRIRSAGYESLQQFNISKDQLVGTMYMVKRMDYGFHIFFIHEPDPNNKLAGKDGIVTEMYYDLRHKEYWIKRNMKPVKFSIRNVDSIFPNDDSDRIKVFEFLSTEGNKGLYEAAYKLFGSMGNEKTEMYGRFFYRLITEHSYFELLHKAGINITQDTWIKNPNGKNPMEILGLSKTKWKLMKKFNIPLKLIQELWINEEAEQRLINYLEYIKKLELEFGIDKVLEFWDLEISYFQRPDSWPAQRYSVLHIAKTYGLPEKRLIRYIYFECDVSQGLRARDARDEYGDYIRMCKEMEYERFDKYPKFLRTYHDIVTRNYNINLNEIEQKQWDKACQENAKYKFAADGYKIFTPMKTDELVREGNVLGHCVASYIGRVRKRLCVIAFLREAANEDEPLVTIEIANGAIVQARRKMNLEVTEEQRAVINKFAKKFNLKTLF